MSIVEERDRIDTAFSSKRLLNARTIAKQSLVEGLLLLVDSRQLVRECFEESFRIASIAGQILSISDIEEWRKLSSASPVPAIIFLYQPANEDILSAIGKTADVFAAATRVPPIIVVADGDDLAQVVDALDAGANGYLPSSVSLEVAIEAMSLVLAGGTYVPASALIASRNKARNEGKSPAPPAVAMFTERQYAVIERLREGKANKTIAIELNMSESTVKVHIRNIMRKLNANNRTEVAFLYQAMLSR